ncbi:LOG family protein YvdD [Paenibacillus sp. P1XP2]|nr:LOG family protein YvdD [Paenibacillus sp. P1XP2]
MKSVAVFCGSSKGASDVYAEGAKQLGKELARRGITLVYGGSSIGVMGAVADASWRKADRRSASCRGFWTKGKYPTNISRS